MYHDDLWLFTVDKTVKVQFSHYLYTGYERDGVISVTVVATRVTSFPYTVEIRPIVAEVGHGIYVAQPGHDFDNKTLFVTFEPNQGSSLQRVANITVKNDTTVGHSSEGFKVLLHLSSDIECSGVDIGYPSTASIIVKDE